MARITFKGEAATLQVQQGTKLIECIRMAGLMVETPCNCMGLCGKCIVKVTGDIDEPTLEEEMFLDGESDFRLSCMAEVKGDIEIEIIKPSVELKTINGGSCIQVEVDSEVKRESYKGIDTDSSVPFIETIGKKVNSAYLLEKVAYIEKKNSQEVYGVTYNNVLMDIDENIEKILGISIDIGTTGISAYLVDLDSGTVLNKLSCLNPQTEFGGDVLSRITYAISNPDGTEILKNSIIKKVNEIIEELTGKDFSRNSIYRIIIAANTTMLHFFAGVNPQSIARAPYRAVFLDKLDLCARDMGIEAHYNCAVTLLPSASSYVGADILAGVAATDFHKKKHSAVFIDIGTNGEIVAISNGIMAATSTAAGPALEGMNISCGCRAEEGAIDSFEINEQLAVSFSTIGNIKPKGICGSALIDIAAFLVKRGIVLPNGRFNSSLKESISNRLIDKKFYITDDIYISQKDIRQIQLAKGAIAAGVILLLKDLNLSIEDVKEVVIAGAFGYHIDPESIKTIGLIPNGFKGDITFVGNSSVEGARLALINKEIIKTIEELKSNMRVVELSTSDSFQKHFVDALGF